MLSIDQSMVAGWVNSYFHSTTENCYYWANTDDLDYTNGTVFGPIQFKTIFSGAALTLAGATYIANPTIDLGNYINPGGVTDLLNNIFYIVVNTKHINRNCLAFGAKLIIKSPQKAFLLNGQNGPHYLLQQQLCQHTVHKRQIPSPGI